MAFTFYSLSIVSTTPSPFPLSIVGRRQPCSFDFPSYAIIRGFLFHVVATDNVLIQGEICQIGTDVRQSKVKTRPNFGDIISSFLCPHLVLSPWKVLRCLSF